MPPNTWTARSATRPSVSAASILTIEIQSRASRPWSISHAARSSIRRAALISMHAVRDHLLDHLELADRLAELLALVRVVGHQRRAGGSPCRSRARRPARAARGRASSRRARGRVPRCRAGARRRASRPRRRARRGSCRSAPSSAGRGRSVTPGRSLSTRNSDTCRGRAAGSVTAETTKKSEKRPSLMKCLLPLSRQPSPSRSARVLMPAASEPAPGSVIAIEQVRSPRTQGSSQRSFCAASLRAATRRRCRRRAGSGCPWCGRTAPRPASCRRPTARRRRTPPGCSSRRSRARATSRRSRAPRRVEPAGPSTSSSSGISSVSTKRRIVATSSDCSSDRSNCMRSSPSPRMAGLRVSDRA